MEKELELLSKNILIWYPFEKGTKILKVEKDFTFENEQKEQYDYLVLIGSLPYVAKNNNMSSEEFIRKISKMLKKQGKILIAVDNKFGLKYFVGENDPYLQKKFASLTNYNGEKDKIETYTKKRLSEILENCGFFGHNFYYPLPDYKCANVIFSDEELPDKQSVSKYVPNYSEKATIFINEIELYKEILKEDKNMFPFFANTFFVEACKDIENIKYKYISFNNMRKEKYRLITKIGNEYVEKEPINDKAKKHYDQIKENIDLLKNTEINIVDEFNDGKIRSLYIDNQFLMTKLLNKILEESKEEEFYILVDKYIEEIKKSSGKMNEKEENIFDKLEIEISENQKNSLNFVKHGFWDMTFQNCFYIENKFYFFDQEWNYPNMPLEFILYRSIIYSDFLRKYFDIDKLLEKYNLNQYIDIFKKLDDKIQEEIRDEQLWEYYKEDKFFNIDATKQEVINIGIREKERDITIDNLSKTVKNLENEKISTFILRKVKRKFRRKK